MRVRSLNRNKIGVLRAQETLVTERNTFGFYQQSVCYVAVVRSLFFFFTSPLANIRLPLFLLCESLPFLLSASDPHLAHCATHLSMTMLSVSQSCSVHCDWASILRLLLLINDLFSRHLPTHGTGWRAHSKSLPTCDTPELVHLEGAIHLGSNYVKVLRCCITLAAESEFA